MEGNVPLLLPIGEAQRRDQLQLRRLRIHSRRQAERDASRSPLDQLPSLGPVPRPSIFVAIGTLDEVAGVESRIDILLAGEVEARQPQAGRGPIGTAGQRALVEPVSAVKVALIPEEVGQAGQNIARLRRRCRCLLVERQRLLEVAHPVQQDGEVEQGVRIPGVHRQRLPEGLLGFPQVRRFLIGIGQSQVHPEG